MTTMEVLVPIVTIEHDQAEIWNERSENYLRPYCSAIVSKSYISNVVLKKHHTFRVESGDQSLSAIKNHEFS